MSKNKKIKIILSCALIAALFSAFAFRFYAINKKYPRPATVTVRLNEPIEYDGYKVTVLSSNLKKAEELSKQ